MPSPTDPEAANDDKVTALELRLEAQDAEIELLRLMVAKLKLQLARKNRALYGVSSEQFDVQATLLDAPPAEPIAAPRAPEPKAAANDRAIDRSLPAHLPRET